MLYTLVRFLKIRRGWGNYIHVLHCSSPKGEPTCPAGNIVCLLDRAHALHFLRTRRGWGNYIHVLHCSSPKGETALSPGRQPWESRKKMMKSPGGAAPLREKRCLAFRVVI